MTSRSPLAARCTVFAARRWPVAVLALALCLSGALVLADAVTDRLIAETSKLRGLAILRPVASRALSRAEIERKVLAIAAEQTTADELRAAELAIKRLGLAPADFDLQATQVQLLTEQIAGLYDPATREFYLADWIDATLQQPVIVHELTHALQDQHFNLRRLTEWKKGDSDAQIAALSVAEGDATLAMSQYVLEHPEVGMLYLQSLQSLPKMPVFENAPRALRESLVFPFVQGLQFVTTLHGRGGWNAVSAAYAALPQSTEQILHLDKYDAREAPIAVTLPDVSRQLGPQWRRLFSDVNGEAGFHIILDQFLKSEPESRRAAAGWGGDRFDVYEGPGGSAVVMLSAWDTEADAREFEVAYRKRTDARAADVGATSGRVGAAFRRPDVLIERRAQRVLIVEGVPTTAALARALWR
jgi:hypothetical protein